MSGEELRWDGNLGEDGFMKLDEECIGAWECG